MPSTQTLKPYRWLARYYDEMFAPLRLPIDAARRRLLRWALPRVNSACDLACGSGETALSLARRGIRVYAVDLSPGMCRLTREKFRAAGLPVRVLRSDMRAFRLPAPVDLIVCEADAINHIPRKADLAKVARCAASALTPGGYFYFDVNNSEGFARYWSGDWWHERPGAVMVMRNGHSARADRAWSDVEWFIREGGLWRRHTERVEEICWSAREIDAALHGAGFHEIHAWDPAEFFGPGSAIGPGCRTVYLARKGSR